MTKLAILSDIHGNLPALEAVLSDIKSFDVDQIVVPGDVIHFGPFSNQVARIVIESDWPVVRGNNEYFLLDFDTPRAPTEWSDPIQFAPTKWINQHFDQDLKNKIATWPDTINLRFDDAPPIQVFHGTPASSWDPIFDSMTDEEIEKILANVETEYVICGHTHLPMDRQINRRHVFNPGSVGLPFDGIRSASYMILDGDSNGWHPTFRRVPFDHEAVLREFETSGYNQKCGPIGRLVVEIHKTARPTFGFLAWRKQFKPNEVISHELLDEYFEKHEWWEFSFPEYHINMEG